MSRFATVKSEDARLDSLSDPSQFGDLDENDPRSVARIMKRMGDEMGEDLGEDLDAAMDEAMAEGDGDGTAWTAMAREAWPTRRVPMKVDVLPGLTGLDEASWNGLLDRSAAPVRLPHLAVADGVGARLRSRPPAADPRGRPTPTAASPASCRSTKTGRSGIASSAGSTSPTIST